MPAIIPPMVRKVSQRTSLSLCLADCLTAHRGLIVHYITYLKPQDRVNAYRHRALC